MNNILRLLDYWFLDSLIKIAQTFKTTKIGFNRDGGQG